MRFTLRQGAVLCALAPTALSISALPAIARAGEGARIGAVNSIMSTPAATSVTVPLAPRVEIPTKDKNGKPIPPAATEREIEMGKKASERIEKDPQIKILDPKKDADSQALYDKLNIMAQKIGKVSSRPLIDYKVKVIEDDQVNAFTLPNGNVYFYTGLLDLLNSDDEIAAVMAHEIGHNACQHALRGGQKSKTATLVGLAMVLAALAGGKNGSNVAAFSQYAMIGVMNGYSIEYEKEADTAGVAEMINAGYNPSAMATVMQRFAAEEKRRPKIDAGIFETHPLSLERVIAIENQIHAAGLEYTPRAVSGAPQAVAVAEKDRVCVKYEDLTLMEFAASSENDNAAIQRAQDAAQSINDLMRANLQMHQLKINEIRAGDKSSVELEGRGILIAKIQIADAKLQNLTPLACAEKWRNNLKPIFWRETIARTS